jgi:hypothetical protein
MLEPVRSAALAEVAVHGIHLALLGAGAAGLAVLLWVSRPRRPQARSEHERARLDSLRAAARAGRLGGSDAESPPSHE